MARLHKPSRSRRTLRVFFRVLASILYQGRRTVFVGCLFGILIFLNFTFFSSRSRNRFRPPEVDITRCQAEPICGDRNRLPTGFGDEDDSPYNCEFSLSSDIEYLPDIDFYACVEANPSEVWGEARDKMYEKISDIQNPSDCNAPQSTNLQEPAWTPGEDKHGNAMRYRYDGTLPKESFAGSPKWTLLTWLHHGYAYNLYVFAWLAGNHWAGGESVIVGNSKYRFSDYACGKSWSCLWSPLSRCNIDQIDDKNVLVYYGSRTNWQDVMNLDQTCRPNGYYDKPNGRCQCDKEFMPSTNPLYSGCAPYTSFELKNPRINSHREDWESAELHDAVRSGDHFYFSGLAPGESNPHGTTNDVHYQRSPSRRKRGFLWEHAQWLWYLHKDAPKRPQLDEYLEWVGLQPNNPEHRSVGIHVRHGDACTDRYQNHRKCLPLSEYMIAVEKLEAKYGAYDVIYLATDDPRVIEDSMSRQYRGFTFIYQPIDRNMYERNAGHGVDVRYEFNNPSVVLEIAKDIWALAHCDAFVGSFASSVAWVAYELSIARKGHYTPFISVDMAWGDKKNVGRFLNEPNE